MRPETRPPTTRTAWWRAGGVLVVVAVLLVGLIVAGESVVALAIVVMEGGAALAVLASAALAGGWIVALLGLGRQPWRERLVIGSALGVGVLSLIVLSLGWAGRLGRPMALAMVAVLAAAGLARLILDFRQRGTANRGRFEGVHWLWLFVCPFLAIALLAACLPPGVLWQEEGFGYDILEYHLAVPKTFHADGRITFLPNNVYSNFPLNSEMLSLLMMTLRGDAIEAAFMAKMVNVALAALFVSAAWLAGCTFSRRAGMVAGVLAGTLPWTAYLAGIAYVEVGMLAMGMCSLVAVLRAERRPDSSSRWLLAAGLLAGLAAGFKYTAVPLIVVPTAVLCLVIRARWRRRVAGLLLFSVAAALTFAPWMARNVVNTANPVFPLAYSVFGAKTGTWDDVLEARWQPAHGPLGVAQRDTWSGQRLYNRTIGDCRMGVVVFFLAALGATMTRRHRWTIALVIMLVWQVAVWMLATHQYARFTVVMLLPLICLAARTLEEARLPALHRLVWALLIAGAGWNLYWLGGLYYHHTRIGGRPINAHGRTDWFVQGAWPGTEHVGMINALSGEVRVMLVGEARSFYVQTPCEYATVFNHHPLADAVRRRPEARAVLQWLRGRGTTHVLVHWNEMRRLRRTYGFYPEINDDLFKRLVGAGLTESASFSFAGANAGPPYATLYEVPPDE